MLYIRDIHRTFNWRVSAAAARKRKNGDGNGTDRVTGKSEKRKKNRLKKRRETVHSLSPCPLFKNKIEEPHNGNSSNNDNNNTMPMIDK